MLLECRWLCGDGGACIVGEQVILKIALLCVYEWSHLRLVSWIIGYVQHLGIGLNLRAMRNVDDILALITFKRHYVISNVNTGTN